MKSIENILHLPTDFKNPFVKDKVDRIHITIQRVSIFQNSPVVADVWFKNGNTDGIQKIEGKDLLTVANKIQTFLETL
jgi:hypothetical protein